MSNETEKLAAAQQKLSELIGKLQANAAALEAAAIKIADQRVALEKPDADERLLSALQAGYRQHANTLRLWMLIYGVGAPALLLSNEKIFDQVRAFPKLGCSITLFMIGILIQMGLSFADKYSAAEWFFKRVSAHEPTDSAGMPAAGSLFLRRAPWEWSRRWLHQNGISASLDALTIALFLCASGMFFHDLTQTTAPPVAAPVSQEIKPPAAPSDTKAPEVPKG